MRIKLRHNKDVVCPYLEGRTCLHPRCYRMRRQECKFYHINEALMKAQMTIIIVPRLTGKTYALIKQKHKEKYLKRINYAKNKVR